MNRRDDERLDRLGTMVTRAGGVSDEELEKIDSSPFLRTRLRSAIESERRRRSEQRPGWLFSIGVATRAVALMVVVTAAAVLSFWLSKPGSTAPAPSEANNNDIARIVTGGACALSTDGCAISNEEVLATLFRDEGERTR